MSAGGASHRPGTTLRKHSVRIAGHATSLSLEEAFWDGLVAIAAELDMPPSRLIQRIDAGRRVNLSSAIRVFVLERYRSGVAVLPDAPSAAKDG